jgi:hypothetical protein
MQLDDPDSAAGDGVSQGDASRPSAAEIPVLSG